MVKILEYGIWLYISSRLVNTQESESTTFLDEIVIDLEEFNEVEQYLLKQLQGFD